MTSAYSFKNSLFYSNLPTGIFCLFLQHHSVIAQVWVTSDCFCVPVLSDSTWIRLFMCPCTVRQHLDQTLYVSLYCQTTPGSDSLCVPVLSDGTWIRLYMSLYCQTAPESDSFMCPCTVRQHLNQTLYLSLYCQTAPESDSLCVLLLSDSTWIRLFMCLVLSDSTWIRLSICPCTVREHLDQTHYLFLYCQTAPESDSLFVLVLSESTWIRLYVTLYCQTALESDSLFVLVLSESTWIRLFMCPCAVRQHMNQTLCACSVRQHLNQTFVWQWTGCGDPVNWPSGSLDLSPLDFWLWVLLRTLKYSDISDVEVLQQWVENACCKIKVKTGIIERVHTSCTKKTWKLLTYMGTTQSICCRNNKKITDNAAGNGYCTYVDWDFFAHFEYCKPLKSVTLFFFNTL
jgi:hypothetical protein